MLCCTAHKFASNLCAPGAGYAEWVLLQNAFSSECRLVVRAVMHSPPLAGAANRTEMLDGRQKRSTAQNAIDVAPRKGRRSHGDGTGR